MASKRALQLLPLRCSASAFIRVAPRTWSTATRATTQSFTQGFAQGLQKNQGPAYGSRRWLSAAAEDKPSKMYTYDDIHTLTTTPEKLAKKGQPPIILLDVREPLEYESGTIPSALNIPVSSQPDALLLPEEEFYDRFGFEKPDPRCEVVFFCKAGVRSRAAAQIAKRAGYEHVGEYSGSMNEWTIKGGNVETQGSKNRPVRGE